MPGIGLWKVPLLSCIFGMISGCSITYDAVGTFEKYQGVLRGEVMVASSGVGILTLEEVGGDLFCSGQSWVTYQPSGFRKQGAEGEASLDCSDGRTVEAKWVQSEENGGRGVGQDQHGNVVRFRYHANAEVLNTYENTLIASNANKDERPPAFEPKPPGQKSETSTGTGFFVTGAGHLVTNFHVIEDAEEIFVLVDGIEHPTETIGVDRANDIAILRTDVVRRPLPLSVQANIRRADEVFTLGYPLVAIQGRQQKATFGRINSLSGIGDDIRFMQVDVPLQPGNSGGPLVGSDGYVHGVVSATLSEIPILKTTGAIPQSVNYAVKSGYVDLLLRASLPRDVSRASSSDYVGAQLDVIVEAYTNSVVLVVARSTHDTAFMSPTASSP